MYPWSHGQDDVVERFIRSAKEEFFTYVRSESARIPALDTLQRAFVGWLVYYNTERAHVKDPNRGQPSSAVISAYLAA